MHVYAWHEVNAIQWSIYLYTAHIGMVKIIFVGVILSINCDAPISDLADMADVVFLVFVQFSRELFGFCADIFNCQLASQYYCSDRIYNVNLLQRIFSFV